MWFHYLGYQGPPSGADQRVSDAKEDDAYYFVATVLVEYDER
eukprot:CAMPEP_0167791432 /NCGR_PEP_ID=MMETSP0111_2-20121227/11941_1 /TAXON_ID=91324 /ORGANISM="Lotharella globosa, Strain CCCM811" /LENGTH=41 /DNA_ID= /DNA_START= /DNA_END= /DNA_ORIENTATION=